MNLSELISSIDELMADAAVEDDLELRGKLLKEASARACQFFRKLNRDIEVYIADLLDQTKLGDQAEPLPIADLMYTNKELAPFRDSKQLRELVLLVGDLIEQRNPKRYTVDILKREFEGLLPDLTKQKLGVSELNDRFNQLQRFFCSSPPDSPPGDPKKSTSPTSGGGGLAKWAPRLPFFDTAFAGVSLLVTLLSPDKSITKPQLPVLPPSVPPIVIVQLQLLAIAALAAFATSLQSRGLIPAEETRPVLEPVLAGAEQEEEEATQFARR
jgi:hypothetical protein